MRKVLSFLPRPLVFLLLAGLIFRLFLSVQIYSGDVNNHVAWAKDILRFGFAGVYDRSFQEYNVMTPTYPPIPLFLFTPLYQAYDFIHKTAWNLNLAVPAFPSNIIYLLQDQDVLPAFLKIPAIFADLGIGWLVFLVTKKILGPRASKWPMILAALVLFNPAFFYNSSYWGQIEAPPLVFLLAAFYGLLFSDRFLISAIAFSLALLTKQTAIVFTPLFAFGYLFRFGIRKSLAGLAAFLITFFALFLPFYRTGNLLFFPFATYFNKIQTGSGSDLATDHAFNFWGIVTGFAKISDSQPFSLGISFFAWGYIVFGLLTTLILFRFFRCRQNPMSFIFAAGLIPFTGFLFLTRMHERYLEQALPFLLLLAPFGRKYLAAFVFLSLFHWLNLYHNWWAPNIPVLIEVLSGAMVINILIVIAIAIFFFLLKDYLAKDCLIRKPLNSQEEKTSTPLK